MYSMYVKFEMSIIHTFQRQEGDEFVKAGHVTLATLL